MIFTSLCISVYDVCLSFTKLLPKNCASVIAQSVNRKKNKDKKNKALQETEKPGKESERKHREEFTRSVLSVTN